MKIRTGFVSNSSSSSFVMMASSEAFDKAYETLNEIERAGVDSFVIEGVVGKTNVKGLSYGIDLNGDETECYFSDDIDSFVKNHPEVQELYDKLSAEDDRYEKYFSCWNVFDRFEDEIKRVSDEMGEKTMSASAGRG